MNMHHYGLEVDKLQSLIATPTHHDTAYGTHGVVAEADDYRLERWFVKSGETLSLTIEAGRELTLFVEDGLVGVGDEEVAKHKQITLAPGTTIEFLAKSDSALYGFSGLIDESSLTSGYRIASPDDYRDKYWGSIQTMVNAIYTGKRLFFGKGQHSSLHFHCNKLEHYYIHTGKLLVRLRAGRGEDRLFTLNQGDTLLIPPGLMHQDGGLEDTVIIEVSTHDVDSDSFIVEDGATMEMPGFGS